MKILIVEDDFLSRKLMQIILSQYGQCDIAVNGVEAVEAFKLAYEEGSKYDLICLDIMMPEMNGHEVLKSIREIERTHDVFGLDSVRIIMTTALADPQNIISAFREQCEGYLVKPIDKNMLIDKIKELGLIH